MVFSASIRGAMITRCITAGISTVASFLLVVFICWSPTGLQSPYSRIIFGLSLADVLQSLGVLVAPFAAPDAPINIFGMGNEQSCEAIGFFTILGSLAVPWYTLHLTYYFLKRVKYKVTPKDFAKKEEKWLHILIWTYSSAVAIYALAKGQINPTRGGSMCYITASPVGCIDKECTRGAGANKTTAFTVIASVVTIFIALFLVLGAFSLHVYFSEKQLQPAKGQLTPLRRKNKDALEDEEQVIEQGEEPKEGNEIEEAIERDEESAKEGQDPKDEEPDEEEVAEQAENTVEGKRNDAIERYAKQAMELVLTKSAIVQSSLYIFAFFFVYCGPVVGLATGYRHSEIIFWWVSIFYPLGGLFNMIIYTRPKVQAVRKVVADLPRLLAFIIILVSGGETPNIMDLMASSTPQGEGQERDYRPPSSRNSALERACRVFGFAVNDDIDAEVDRVMREEANVDHYIQNLSSVGGGSEESVLLF